MGGGGRVQCHIIVNLARDTGGDEQYHSLLKDDHQRVSAVMHYQFDHPACFALPQFHTCFQLFHLQKPQLAMTSICENKVYILHLL